MSIVQDASSRIRLPELVLCGAAAAGVAGIALRAPHLGAQLAAVIVAGFALRAAVTHLRTALLVLFVFLPVQQPVLAYLYAHGLPLAVTRNLGFFKELVTAAALLAAVGIARSRPWRLTLVDKLVAAYVTVLLIFTLGPVLLPGALGGQSFFVLVTSFRSNTMFLILFFACRRLAWTQRDLKVLSIAVIVPAAANIVPVLWERYANDSFIRLTVNTLHFPAYRREVLGISGPDTFLSVHTPGVGVSGIRAGGWFYEAGALAFFCILAVALVSRWLAEPRPHPALWLLAAVLAVTLTLTLTRSAVLSGVFAVILIVLATARYRLPGRLRLVVGAGLGVLVIAPLIGASGFGDRISDAVGGRDASTSQHATGSAEALRFVERHPAGTGLATRSQEVGSDGSPLAAAENAYLQIGVEVGVVPMLMFVGIVITGQRELSRARGDGTAPEATALWAAGWALALNGMFLSVYLPFGIAMTFWPLAAIAVVAARQSAEPFV